MTTAREPSFQKLLGFLDHDPKNPQLIADTAYAAYDAGEMGTASDLLDRYSAIGPLAPPLLNLRGLVSISESRFDVAAEAFETLLAQAPDDPAIRFNLAWCKALLSDWPRVSDLLDESITTPRAAALRVQALHHLARLDEALAWGQGAAERFPDDKALMGALAVVALDAERLDLAQVYASKAEGAAEGMSTLGMLQLAAADVHQALDIFDRTLKAHPQDARALLGKGLGLLELGDGPAAAAYIDKGAAEFGDHLGSWVAAGWAHFIGGDYPTSRARFETALGIDETFAETHGGLAVIDVMENDLDSARRRVDIALRLDRRCFAGALARSMIAAADGDTATAERVRAIALNAPIGPDGRTIAQAMVGIANRRAQ